MYGHVESDLSMSAQSKNEHNVWASNSRNLYLLKKKKKDTCNILTIENLSETLISKKSKQVKHSAV